MSRRTYFEKCTVVGCHGKCSDFEVCERKEFVVNDKELSLTFVRIAGEDQCWVEMEPTD